MIKAHIRILRSLSLIIIGLSGAVASAETTLRFATIDYCPFTCDPAKDDGREGFMTTVLRAALEPEGYEIELDMLPYVRAVRSVQLGTHDGIVVVGRDYAPELIYPSRPTVSQRVMFLVNRGAAWRYKGIDSLAQARVGIVGGYHYVDQDLIDYLEHQRQNEALVQVILGESTTERGLNMLTTNRITTFLEGEYSAMYELDKIGAKNTVETAGYTQEAFDDYTAFSPRNPHSRRYAEILSETLESMSANGQLDEILREYGITQTPVTTALD